MDFWVVEWVVVEVADLEGVGEELVVSWQSRDAGVHVDRAAAGVDSQADEIHRAVGQDAATCADALRADRLEAQLRCYLVRDNGMG